jgi:hypothetical protein
MISHKLMPMRTTLIGFSIALLTSGIYTNQVGAAPSITRILVEDSDTAKYLNATTKTIIYVAPYIKSAVIAQAISDAVLKRGVKVYLLLEINNIADKDAYSNYLSMLQHHPIYKKFIAVRTSKKSLSYVALIDSRTILRGKRIASPTTPFDQNIGLVSVDYADVTKFNRYFRGEWERATSYKPKVGVPNSPK